MGYWKDNFPGSPAALQRVRIAKGTIVYAVVVGALMYQFSPYAVAFREAHKEGAWDNPPWAQEYIAKKNFGMTGYPTKRGMQKSIKAQDDYDAMDFTRPRGTPSSSSQISSNSASSATST